jgi:electron transfer flavoprotein alpha subunit
VTNRIFTYIVHKSGVADDTAGELAAAAERSMRHPAGDVTGWGADLDTACNSLRDSYAVIWKIARENLAYPNAELVRKALARVLPADCILLVPHAHFGVDLSPGLSVKMNTAYVSDVVQIDSLEGPYLKMVRQEFGGQVSTHVRCDVSSGAVVNIRPGALHASESAPAGGTVVDKSPEAGELAAGRRYLETLVAETGDVDISKQPVLVSVGRGIQEKDNVTIAEELAEAMGGAVSCSRPVVDAKWMVVAGGLVGQTVKPKVYLACGISGAFQHLAGIRATLSSSPLTRTEGTYFPGGGRGNRGRHPGVPAGDDRQGAGEATHDHQRH